jgi:hypothetical protein
MVDIKDMCFTRGEDGTLIAQEVELESLPDKPKVKLVPLTRGKIQEVYALANSSLIEDKVKSDLMVIKNGLTEPKLTDEQIADLKPTWAVALTTAILAISLDIPQNEVTKKTADIIADEEFNLKKK